MVLDVKPGFFNLHPLNTPIDWRSLGRFVSRLFNLRGRLLHGCQRVVRLAWQGANRVMQLLRGRREQFDQFAGVIAQRVSTCANAAENAQYQYRCAQCAWNPEHVQPTHHRRKCITEEHANQHRNKDSTRPVQREHAGQRGDHHQRHAAHVDRHMQQHARQFSRFCGNRRRLCTLTVMLN